jgi:Do/DeqQ family serine protease
MKTARNYVLALVAALGLLTGAAWRSAAAVHAAPPATAAATAAPAPLQHAIAGGRDSYADVVNVVSPAVVTVRVEGRAKVSPTQFQGDDFFRRFFGDQLPFDRQGRDGRNFRAPKQRALGSGVIVSTDGYILTNDHVVDGADQVHVELTDGRTFSAKVVGTDKPTDLAVLKVNASDLHALPLGNSDAVQVGDVVLAVGNPLGIGQSVTMGIISAKGRSTATGDGSYEDFLQTDAPINHGNSGGALVNTKGELVGINSQILSDGGEGNIGIGFAIPANMAKHVMDDLRKDGVVHRAQLGVTVQPVTADMAESLGLEHPGGAIVSSVKAGSAADRAGIKQGDVIEAFNGQEVHDFNALRNHVAEAAPGSNASVAIIRNGSEKTLTVKLDEANAEETARNRGSREGSDDKAALGISVAPLTPDVAAKIGAPKNTKGVVVENVDPDGRAADLLQSGDVIEQVNHRPVQSADDLRAAVRTAGDKPMLMLINRQGNDLFVTVRPTNG